jgi:NAD(P)-dependent dehydrogenase (short-subunit alcohol dehydrogenase family)
MLQELDGKVAVITGGGSGIGAALSKACGAEGMQVVVVDVNEERAAKVAAELPDGKAVARAVDVANADAVQALADFAFDAYGAVHLLCNNAGISPTGRIWDFTDDDWHKLLGINIRGVANGIRSFVPRMIEQGEGHILNTGSGASFVATPHLGPYCATKHAIVGLSEGLRFELDGTGLGVSVLVPAGVNTNIGDSMVRSSASDPDMINEDFTVLMNSLDPTSLDQIEPDVVADVAIVGIKEGWDYIVMGPGQHVGVERRYAEVLGAHWRSKERFPFLP